MNPLMVTSDTGESVDHVLRDFDRWTEITEVFRHGSSPIKGIDIVELNFGHQTGSPPDRLNKPPHRIHVGATGTEARENTIVFLDFAHPHRNQTAGHGLELGPWADAQYSGHDLLQSTCVDTLRCRVMTAPSRVAGFCYLRIRPPFCDISEIDESYFDFSKPVFLRSIGSHDIELCCR